MIEKALLENLSKIFGMKFNRLESPGESEEQDTLFIEVEQTHLKFKDAREVGRVTGSCVVFTQGDKMPIGYFAQRINMHPDLCERFFFSDLDRNVKGIQNIQARSFSFVYFFDSQYDPAIGTITSVSTNLEVIP